MVKVVRIDAEVEKPRGRIGFVKGQLKVPDDFDSMGANEIADMFEGTTK
ncbi:hypothetical protein [Caballeronia calidae]